MHRRRLILSSLAALTLSALPARALSTSAGEVVVDTVVTGLRDPWALGFLPEGGLLVTEKSGRLLYFRAGQSHAVAGLPRVAARGQGGLLDVLVPRDFARTRDLYFTYAKPQAEGAGTAIGRARLSEDARRLWDWRDVFELTPGSSGGRHFGSRLVEGPDGLIYATVGERGDRPSAQDLGRENGSVIRIARDGSIPAGNPFTKVAGAQPAIYSYGHRNPQGAAFDAAGELWVVEHGARGGDELNQIKRGANYGWPIISYGRHYSGARIGEGSAKPGMEQPAHYWDPSIAPSGLMIYSGRLWPQWRGAFFTGSLKFDYLARLDATTKREVERLEAPEFRRLRDVREGPDGAIWILSEGTGTLLRMTPG
ncbi:PQQ-dependent sugar dehydrogenase [Roseovarius aestuariivivens]|uniref:PQQ-dependent sugar dehydrogenase n=1 Tax=Roseovarius aestuariivivens TaxID=1888910 RepID=UPI001080B653|nr:PQQ-dependent sugar dehydrogenase [Roseovarius aestuariivivens]